MRDFITKKQFITTCIINGINTIFYFIGYSYGFDYRQLVFITIITLDFNSIYLFLTFICDLSIFVFNSEKLENMNDILRNKIAHVINPISYFVTFMFWVLIITGGIKDAFEDTIAIIYSIYAHFIISILIIIDLFVADHKRHYFSWITLIFIFVYVFLYLILLCVVTFKYDDPPYHFLEDIKIWALLLYFALFSVIIILCYFLQIYLMKIKYLYILKMKDVPQNYNEEINKVIQMTDISPEN